MFSPGLPRRDALPGLCLEPDKNHEGDEGKFGRKHPGNEPRTAGNNHFQNARPVCRVLFPEKADEIELPAFGVRGPEASVVPRASPGMHLPGLDPGCLESRQAGASERAEAETRLRERHSCELENARQSEGNRPQFSRSASQPFSFSCSPSAEGNNRSPRSPRQSCPTRDDRARLRRTGSVSAVDDKYLLQSAVCDVANIIGSAPRARWWRTSSSDGANGYSPPWQRSLSPSTAGAAEKRQLKRFESSVLRTPASTVLIRRTQSAADPCRSQPRPSSEAPRIFGSGSTLRARCKDSCATPRQDPEQADHTNLADTVIAEEGNRAAEASKPPPRVPLLSGQKSYSRRHSGSRRGSGTGGGGFSRQASVQHRAGPGSTGGGGGGGLTRARKTVQSTAHFLSLMVAEHPLEQHQQYLKEKRRSVDQQGFALWASGASELQGSFTEIRLGQADPWGSSHDNPTLSSDTEARLSQPRPSLHADSAAVFAAASELGDFEPEMGGRSAWAAAVTTIITSSMMVRFAETMADRGAPPDERLYAVIRLECLLHDNPYKRRAITVLTSLIKGKRPTLGERLQVEVIITGERMLAWFTPAAMDHHRLYFSVAYMLVIVTTFFFMAGEYSVYSAIESGEEVKYGPHELMDLVSLQSSLETVFSREFLWEWGGRDAPGLMEAGGWTRWCTSVLLHNTFQHMLSNLLLTLALAFHLESKYGAWRISLLWVLSSSGGQLMSALFEDPCHLVVGASGGVFGMMGLFVADMVVNFQTIKRPILRCLLIIIFGIFFTVTLVNTDNVSHASHAGGLVCGLFLSFLFLPRLRVGYRWELILPALGACVLLAVFVCVPPYIYEVRYSEVVC